MRRAASLLSVHAATLCQSSFGQAPNPPAGQQALGRAEVIHAQLRGVAINTATNSGTLRGPRGNLADVDVNPSLADISPFKACDKLGVAYQQALLSNIDKLATKRCARTRGDDRGSTGVGGLRVVGA